MALGRNHGFSEQLALGIFVALFDVIFFVFQLVICDTYTRLARGGKGQRATRPGAGQERNAGASVRMQFKTKQ